MNKRESKKHLDDATHFEFSAQQLQRYYDKWATIYNADVDNEDYVAPQIVVDLVNSTPLNENSSILDAGCGTGLLGRTLKEANYTTINGFDLSLKMAQLAIDTGAYSEVKANVDIMKVSEHYQPNQFDCIVSSGVFTLGHVPPEALLKLLNITKVHGYLVISTRTQYNEATDYLKYSQQWLEQDLFKVVNVVHHQPYTKLDTSTYWIYQKLNQS